MNPSRAPLPWIAILLILLGSAIHLQFNPVAVFKDLGNSEVLAREFLALDFSVGDKVILAIVETIEMALLGSAIGFGISIPISLVAAKNASPVYLSVVARGVLNLLWSIPALLWAIVLVAVVGLGPSAGIIAIALFTIGLSGKYLYEIYESQNPSAYDAIKVIGASRIQMVRYVTIPEALPYLASQFLFVLSYNIRESSILGLVGAGGIGFYIIHYLESIQYSKASVFILAVLITIFAMDVLSSRLRKRLVT